MRVPRAMASDRKEEIVVTANPAMSAENQNVCAVLRERGCRSATRSMGSSGLRIERHANGTVAKTAQSPRPLPDSVAGMSVTSSSASAAPLQLLAQSFDEPLIPLPAFGLGRGLRGVGADPLAVPVHHRSLGDRDSQFDISRRNRSPRPPAPTPATVPPSLNQIPVRIIGLLRGSQLHLTQSSQQRLRESLAGNSGLSEAVCRAFRQSLRIARGP
jgi:hypothetical protein